LHAPSESQLITYTLCQGATLLGEGDLAPTRAGDDALGGPFRPTEAFAAVRPAFDALVAARGAMAAALGGLPDGAGADEIREQLRAPGAGAAVGTALAAVEALGLEVRDPAGRALAGVQAVVAASALRLPGGLTPEQHAAAERDAAAAGFTLGGPHYLLIVTPRPARGGAPAGASAEPA
jgi:hypothetical protein